MTQTQKQAFKWIAGGNNANNGNGPAISDGGQGFGFPNYINGEQALAMQSTSFIEQTIYLVAGTYEFSLYYMGRANGIVNPIQVSINDVIITTITKQVSGWTLFTYTFNILVAEDKTLRLEGTENGDVTTGIDLVALSKKDGVMNSNFENLLANISNKTPYAYFRADDYDPNTREIPALIGDFTAKSTGDTLTVGERAGNGADASILFLNGTNNSIINFNINVPQLFTMCSITRFTFTNKQGRIITASGGNLIHGHEGGNKGTAYYELRMTNDNLNNNNDWLIMCGKNDSTHPKNILANNIAIGTVDGGLGGYTGLGINNRNDFGHFTFNQIIVWDTVLTDDEMQRVSDYLTKYLKNGI
jgi:hypothetical protein